MSPQSRVPALAWLRFVRIRAAAGVGAGLLILASPASRAQQPETPRAAQAPEVQWSEASSGSGEIPLGSAFDLDYQSGVGSDHDFQYEPWEGANFWAPKRGCTVGLAAGADFASFDIARSDSVPRASDRLHLCGGSAAPLTPGTVLIATTTEVRFSKVVIDSCGETLKFRYVTYDRKVTQPKAVPVGIEAPIVKIPPDGIEFEHEPRDLLLAWGTVPGAASYTLEVDCRGCCAPRKEMFCSEQENGKVFLTQPGLTTPAYYTIWLGAFRGRWRVRAVKADGSLGPFSPWTSFSFKK